MRVPLAMVTDSVKHDAVRANMMPILWFAKLQDVPQEVLVFASIHRSPALPEIDVNTLEVGEQQQKWDR